MARTWPPTKVGGLVLLFCAHFPLKGLASVEVENSVTLSREILSLSAGDLASYEYALDAGNELIFSVQLGRWRRDPLRIWLVDEFNYERLTREQPFDYVAAGTGVVRREAWITYNVQEGGRYFVILDNTNARSAREIEVYAYARIENPGPGDRSIRRFYEIQFDTVAELVDLGDIEVSVQRCGGINAWSIGPRIVICRELDNILTVLARPGVRRFIFLHEISHSLIDRWGYRSIVRNQFMVDRLAAALFAVLDEDGLAESTAEWFLQNSSIQNELIIDEFAISNTRARRIAKWLRDDGDLEQAWIRRIVVPRLRAAALETLATAPHLDETSRRQIARELLKREVAVSET